MNCSQMGVRSSACLRLVALVRGVRGAIGMHGLLQPLQRFRKQGKNRLARLMGECDKQTFLFRRQSKRARFHSLTIPRAPHIFKERLRLGYGTTQEFCRQFLSLQKQQGASVRNQRQNRCMKIGYCRVSTNEIATTERYRKSTRSSLGIVVVSPVTYVPNSVLVYANELGRIVVVPADQSLPNTLINLVEAVSASRGI